MVVYLLYETRETKPEIIITIIILSVMKNETKKPVKKVQPIKAVSTPKVSKRLTEKMEKISGFNSEKANNFTKLLHVSNLAEVETFGLNRALKIYIEKANEVLSPSQIALLTFGNVKTYIEKSKYKDLPVFSFHQITLICNGLIKEQHAETKRSEKAVKQGAKVGKDADKVSRRNTVKVEETAKAA